MSQTLQIVSTSLKQGLQELRANKLRTALSLLGITIGIFCIIAVLTVLDSMQANIRKEVSSLGSDVLYINRWPWMDEGGEYKWWEYYQRRSMMPRYIRTVETELPDVDFATLSLTTNNNTLRHQDNEIQGISGHAVMRNYDKVQNIEIGEGRYLSPAELDGGAPAVVLGYDTYTGLFPSHGDAIGSYITFQGRRYAVIGILKKLGQNMTGIDFDNGVIYPYYAAASSLDLSSNNYDPMLIVKASNGVNVNDLKLEVEGILRRERKVRPGKANDFSINQLSQISERLDVMFSTINFIGGIIGGFSLLVGTFGIANIMFVTVKERTKIIGLKKAIGARSSVILTEFLTEAVVLCLIGGMLGILTVLLLAVILTYAADFPVMLSFRNFTLGIGISAFVGVIAGIIPAYRASRLNPVVAIRTT